MTEPIPDTDTVHVYTFGVCHMSVCAPKDMERDEVRRLANLKHPTGLKHTWEFSNNPKFATGQPNPCPCNEHPETRLHYLMVC